jgi:fluoride exporter
MILAALAVVGGLGAMARFLLDGAVSSRLGRAFPFGTLAVNLTGAFALGALYGAAVGGDALRLAGVGFLGAYTTFSTWALEAHRLGEDGRTRLGLADLLVSLALGLGCAWLGRELGAAL